MFSKKDLQKLIIPLIIEQLLAVTVGMADTVMVAGVGEAAVSGVSLVDSINILLINIFSALATGGAIIAAQYIGRGEPEHACDAAKQLVLVVGMLSLAICGICVIGSASLLEVIFGQAEPAVMQNAQIYFFLSALSYPFIALYNAGAALFRTMNHSKVSMLIALLMNIVNIGGNAILIFGFKMGVAGAALASLCSRIMAAVIILALLRKQENVIHIESYFKIHFHPKMIRTILKIGIPNGLENGMFQVGKILVAGLITSFGTTAIAANAVSSSVASMALIPGSAIGLAMLTVVGQCVGANQYDQAKKYVFKLTGLAYLSMAAVNVLILLTVNQIVGFYGLSAETSGMAVEILIWHSIVSMILWPASFTLPNGLRAASDVTFTMTVAILSMWICRIGMSYVLGQSLGFGLLGTWFAMFLDWAFRSFAFLWRLSGSKWKTKRPF